MRRRAAFLLAAGLVFTQGARAAEIPEPPDWSVVGDEAAKQLSAYIRIDTSNPPGNETAGAEFLGRFFDAESIAWQLLQAEPGRASIVARLPATHPDPERRGPILLLSHVDVVPADPDAWSFAPFSGAIEDGTVYGRGALDDKSQGVVHALAMALLGRHDVPRRREVVFAATAAEEAGVGVGVDWLVEHHWEALGPPAVVWNEGGVSTRNGMLGDRIVNAVATSEKQALWMTLVSEGEGGHGSMPVRDAAADRLVAALERLSKRSRPVHVTETVSEMLQRLAVGTAFPSSFAMRHAGNRLVRPFLVPRLERSRVVRPMLRDTISLTGLDAGLKHNVIPRRAEARLDVRLLPDTEPEAFLAWLREALDEPGVRFELEPDAVAFQQWLERIGSDGSTQVASPTENELFRALEAELARELPGSVTVPLQTTGGTDSKWFRARGVPAYGYLPVVLPEELVSSVHGLDERIPTAELERAVRVTYRTLARLVQ